MNVLFIEFKWHKTAEKENNASESTFTDLPAHFIIIWEQKFVFIGKEKTEKIKGRGKSLSAVRK